MFLTVIDTVPLRSSKRFVFIMGVTYVLCDVRTDIQYVCRFILVVGLAVARAVSLVVLIAMAPFDSGPFLMRFVVDKVALWLFPVRVTQPILHTHRHLTSIMITLAGQTGKTYKRSNKLMLLRISWNIGQKIIFTHF